ncbi:succinic semialdehyde dehydrogenase [Streptomyces sp. NPDC048638]|uniref:succinic semialdehyde dehydrogenase n=1 Tax=Streptomyces sp. NPDC048638 TaxID=3365580 RepID=UPI003721B644
MQPPDDTPAGHHQATEVHLPLGRAAVPASGNTYITSIAPFTGAALGQVPHCDAGDVDRAFIAARTAQQRWSARDPRQRAAVFLRFHDLLLRHQDEVLDLIQLESGKARKHAFEEIIDAALTTRYYSLHGRALLRPRRRRGALPLLTTAVEHRRARGVVGVLTPWNYPLTFAVGDVLPALIAGNGVVCKPDVHGAFTAVWVQTMMRRAGLPEGLFQIVTGPGHQVGPLVVTRSDYVCFTGSTKTGRDVAQLAGAHLIGCTLELGGKNAFIVLDDADVDDAAAGAVRACYTSAGQLCMSTERVLVHTGRYDVFLHAFAEKTRALRLGTSLDYHADMGSLVSATHLEAVHNYVADAVNKGARLVTGGHHRPEVGPFFYEPTILTDVTPHMPLHGQEVFGPVAAVYPFHDEHDAIRQANTGPFGLNASIWTSRPRRGRNLGTHIRTGTVNINEPYAAAYASLDAPMGGMKDSGIGRRHGREGILNYTESQTIATQRFLPLDAPANMSSCSYARLASRLLRLTKRFG